MFRRVETLKEGEYHHGIKGLFRIKYRYPEVNKALNDLPEPPSPIQQQCFYHTGLPYRFFFTEKGWDLFGKVLANAAERAGVLERIRELEETVANIVWQDEFQVIVEWDQPSNEGVSST